MTNTKGIYTDINGNDKEIILNDEEMNLCDANLSERILYYIAYPYYFFEKTYETISTLSWKL
tara:strand:- start:715 stop:900 length:186 start_codon:yes stop_codon:yes gene_type:complete